VDTRRVAVYYAWSRPAETGAPLTTIEDRFPALFESRRMLYPRLQELADAGRFDQSIAGFIDHVLRRNFAAFVEQAAAQTSRPVLESERVRADGGRVPLDDRVLDGTDTLIVISFDSLRTGQRVRESELRAVREFVAKPGNLLIVAPHHDIGEGHDIGEEDDLGEGTEPEAARIREADFRHHGDRTIPPRQGFGGFARSLLAGLGVPVENRFGLRPAAAGDGSPAPVEIAHELDRLRILDGVRTFNNHPHLPHLERIGDAVDGLDVLVRQRIDPDAPPHAFTSGGRWTFDAMLQSRPGVFGGDLLVTDATLWSSTAGGLDSLSRLWRNVVGR
jgi:hypothetical protein